MKGAIKDSNVSADAGAFLFKLDGRAPDLSNLSEKGFILSNFSGINFSDVLQG